MDYRKFLGKQTTEVLPYLGGASVDAPKRRLRVTREVAPGWWSFVVSGRRAEPDEPADAPDMSALPRTRGHLVGDRLFVDGDRPHKLSLLPEEELEAFAVVAARRWSADLWVFEAVDFEGDAETIVRELLDDRAAIRAVSGVAASLRAAYGWALVSTRASERRVPVALAEARGSLRRIADDGRDAADALIDSLVARRREARQVQQERSAVRRAEQAERTARDRVTHALDEAGATLRRMRSIGGGALEVRFTFMDETFVSTVETATLQVLDSGICLSGADRVTNLASLPAVIREAIETDQLCITRS